jgi:hypothetical protein
MSYQIVSSRVAVSFIFAIARKMPRERKALERVAAVAIQAGMITRLCRANNIVSEALQVAVTTYRRLAFVDHPVFSAAVEAAEKHGAELLLADVFSFMRNLDGEAALRCIKTLDALPIDVINAHDGRVWAKYSRSEKQNLYLAAKSATAIHGNNIKRGLAPKSGASSRVTAEARERASATLSKNANRRALELKTTIARIRNDAGDAELGPTAVAKELNELGHKTSRGHAWSATTAKRLLHRLHRLEADAPTLDQKQR